MAGAGRIAFLSDALLFRCGGRRHSRRGDASLEHGLAEVARQWWAELGGLGCRCIIFGEAAMASGRLLAPVLTVWGATIRCGHSATARAMQSPSRRPRRKGRPGRVGRGESRGSRRMHAYLMGGLAVTWGLGAGPRAPGRVVQAFGGGLCGSSVMTASSIRADDADDLLRIGAQSAVRLRRTDDPRSCRRR